MVNPDQILAILNHHPELTIIEDVLKHCKIEGVEAGFWLIYFVARGANRPLMPRLPEPFSESDLYDMASSYLRLLEGVKQALETFDKLERMNNTGTRIDWEKDGTSPKYGWELSVAQELVELAGGFPEARSLIMRSDPWRR